MGKLPTLLFPLLLTMASTGGYLYLTAEINAGETRLAQGREQLATGKDRLEKGKAQLAEGRQELAAGRKKFRQAKTETVEDFLRGDDKGKELSDAERLQALVQGGMEYEDARERLAKGKRQVAGGERRVEQGKQRLAAGKQYLRQGQEQLSFARHARVACAIAAVVFGSLSIGLALLWRRSLFSNAR